MPVANSCMSESRQTVSGWLHGVTASIESASTEQSCTGRSARQILLRPCAETWCVVPHKCWAQSPVLGMKRTQNIFRLCPVFRWCMFLCSRPKCHTPTCVSSDPDTRSSPAQQHISVSSKQLLHQTRSAGNDEGHQFAPGRPAECHELQHWQSSRRPGTRCLHSWPCLCC